MYRYIHKDDLNNYEIDNKRLSYYNLFYKDEGLILCNNIANDWDELEVMNGDEYGEEIYQYYIINDDTANRLINETDEIILYHNRLDLYILGVCHYGTSWRYVLTDFRLEETEDEGWYKAVKIEEDEDNEDEDEDGDDN